MELKAELIEPFTEQERLDFIVTQNHRLGYEIRETEREVQETIIDPETGEEIVITKTVKVLEAWGEDAAERLEDLRQTKYRENERIRDTFLVSGVEYRDILWDSDLEQKLNLMAQTSVMDDEETVIWVAMDGVTALECTKQDLLNIGGLLTKMTAYVWQFKNPAIKAAIAEAQTEEELHAIEIVYDMGEINEQPIEEAENEL